MQNADETSENNYKNLLQASRTNDALQGRASSYNAPRPQNQQTLHGFTNQREKLKANENILTRDPSRRPQENELKEVGYEQGLRRSRAHDRSFEEKFVLELALKVSDKLNKQIEMGHETNAFVIALFLAALKDGALDVGLDFLFGFGEIPFIGQLPGLFVTATLIYFLWGKGWFNRAKIKMLVFVLGLFLDNIPLANDLPLTVLTVFMAWHVVRSKAREAEESMEGLNKKTLEELEILDQEE